MKVVHASQAVAGPFGATILAEHGADVLWLENALAPDPGRLTGRKFYESERKNQRTLALNIPSEEGREILARILSQADVFIENGKGGQYEKWGLSDEELWRINPRLIIAHVSGFGQSGDPDYVGRPAYDAIAQAYSGYTWYNSNGVTAPYPAPLVGDYVSALFQVIGILIARERVRETGVGESVDVAMFECLLKIHNDHADYFSDRVPEIRAGLPYRVAGYTTMRCADGEYLQLCLSGTGIMKKAIPFLGLEYGSDDFPAGIPAVPLESPAGKRFTDAIHAYLTSRTAAQAEQEMLAAGLPVAKVNTLADIQNDPHILARDTLEEWTTFKGDKVKTVGPLPKLKRNPGQTWRAAPLIGMDNDEVLAELGYSAEQIAAFYQTRVIAREPGA